MARKIIRSVLAVLAALVLAMPPWPALACGPYFAEPGFVLRTRPDYPAKNFADGKLGIVQPSYYHEYLFVAYRYLNSAPLSASEQKNWLGPFGDTNTDFADSDATARSKEPDWIETWKKESSALLKTAQKPNYYDEGYGVSKSVNDGDRYFFYYNCLPNAFQNAVETLHSRQKEFGESSPAVLVWTSAQTKVFENCGARWDNGKPASPAVLPDPANREDPVVIQKDRIYQIAAAQFYAGDLEGAKKTFDTIAGDTESPWQKIAPYLAARCTLRQGTLADSTKPDYQKFLTEAKLRFENIVSDQSLPEWHSPSQRMLRFIEIRLEPASRANTLARILQKNSAGANFVQDLKDYLWLLDHPVPTSDLSGKFEKNEMTDWIETVRSTSAESNIHALQQWKRSSSQVWLIAALQKAKGSDIDSPALVAAAAKIPKNGTAFTTAIYHRLRLLLESGKSSETRAEVDQMLALPVEELPTTARNQFLELRLRTARTLEEFAKFAPRTPAAVIYDGEYMMDRPEEYGRDRQQPPRNVKPGSYFDLDSTTSLNSSFSIAELKSLAETPSLPIALRSDVALGAWTKSIAIENLGAARSLTETVAKTNPSLASAISEWEQGNSKEEKQFGAILLILRNPGLRPYVSAGYPRETERDKIDNLRQNWWCAIKPEDKEPSISRDYPFLSDESRKTAQAENTALQSLGAAPNWLGDKVLAFAKSHPKDARVPEALYLVVRATRYGCTDDKTSEISKAAFALLHRDYPASEWTKKTPYWF